MIESLLIYGSDWDETELQTMNYVTALFRKKHAACDTLDVLLKEPYAINNDIINEVVKAIAFNQELIDKCLGRSKDDY